MDIAFIIIAVLFGRLLIGLAFIAIVVVAFMVTATVAAFIKEAKRILK